MALKLKLVRRYHVYVKILMSSSESFATCVWDYFDCPQIKSVHILSLLPSAAINSTPRAFTPFETTIYEKNSQVSDFILYSQFIQCVNYSSFYKLHYLSCSCFTAGLIDQDLKLILCSSHFGVCSMKFVSIKPKSELAKQRIKVQIYNTVSHSALPASFC